MSGATIIAEYHVRLLGGKCAEGFRVLHVTIAPRVPWEI